MVKRRLVPAQVVRKEIRVKNSLFLASLTPAFRVEEAREFIQQIRAEFPDASHHVPAYLIGTGASVTAHCSDDGEPAGTAGRPALAVLQGSDLGNVAVVVTRYFGGTKLGTGGLVRAYTEAVQLVVGAVPRAHIVEGTLYLLEVPYGLLDQIQYSFEQGGIDIQDREFGSQVILTVFVMDESKDWFLQEIANISSGALEPVFIERKEFLQLV